MTHSFHIPVLGLGFSIDTPLKVAKYGISSVVSIVDDELVERMRKHHLMQENEAYQAIETREEDYRAKRITSYLNLLNQRVEKQINALRNDTFSPDSELTKYFQLLPAKSPLKAKYEYMLRLNEPSKKEALQEELKKELQAGAIEVNIMSKVDKVNFLKNGTSKGDLFTDALAALRGFAKSELNSSVILSAGMNPRLYQYLTEFSDFFPIIGSAKKKVILKVSDYRSALIQAKFLAKKGIWVHEFRIESGLNCGGHAFATEGYLLGPILEEFKSKREELRSELFTLYQPALEKAGILVKNLPLTRITVQGGIGNQQEDQLLQSYYCLDGTGWGSPFLLVPEATNVDEGTLQALQNAKSSDFYASGASPLGVPINDFKSSSSETLRLERIAKGKPGSPCVKKYLVSNTEFTEQPICTASRKYQSLKIKELQAKALPDTDYREQYEKIVEKACLCEGLATSAYLKNGILEKKERSAVAICPGPNTAYFKRTYSLEEMIKHIYGKINLLEGVKRSHVYINELKLYIEYFKKDVENHVQELNSKNTQRLQRFKNQLLNGIEYYQKLVPELKKQKRLADEYIEQELIIFRDQLEKIIIPITTH